MKFLLLSILFLSLTGLTSCKKERTCTCTLTYFNSPTQTRVIPIGKATIKKGQETCNDETKKIIEIETSNGINGATCVVKE